MEPSAPATRRRHSKALKTLILAQCAEPGVSVAAIALSHGLNANLVHRWRRLASLDEPQARLKTASSIGNAPRFVALPLPTAPVSPPDIRVELRRGAMAIAVSWPVAAAAECGAWLGEWLR